MIVLTVEQNVRGVVITSSPGPMPNAAKARWRPEVAEFTANACGARTYSPNSRSKRAVFGPVVSQPDFNVSMTSSISSFPIAGRLNGINESMRSFAYVSNLHHARTNDDAWQKLERIEFIEYLSGLICESCTNGGANKIDGCHDPHPFYFTETVMSAVATTKLLASYAFPETTCVPETFL